MLPLCRSPVSLMQAFLSEKLALKSSGIPRGLILSSTSSHLDLYSIPGRGEHNYYFAEIKPLFFISNLADLVPQQKSRMNAPPTFESFLLYDGEKKITREQDTKVRFFKCTRKLLIATVCRYQMRPYSPSTKRITPLATWWALKN